ncbi:MAG: HAD family hydrolase [Thaumarchaeota archaeon]|nr:HAD family hydrolase [Nitrososphaerota archaeon]
MAVKTEIDGVQKQKACIRLQARALLFDLRVFAEIDIDYLQASQFLENGGASGTLPIRDILKQLSERSQKIAKEDYPNWIRKVSDRLDEIEIEQIGKFQLHMGVRDGLDSLQPMDLSIYVLTETGKEAGEKFLSQHNIRQYVNEVISRENAEGIGDLGERLDVALNKLELLPEECVYFCNRLSDLKVAKSANFRTIILPSRREKINNLIVEGSDGMIISLEEIPSLLLTETFKATTAEEPQVEIAENLDESKEMKNLEAEKTEL